MAYALTLLSAFLLPSGAAGAALSPTDLRCEHRTDPLGIDVSEPRLSWTVESPDRGARQTAYRILVASTQTMLDSNMGDLWDSGKVLSDNIVDIVYGGASLTSRMECFWKVRVWDETDTASGWSAPAYWSMGLLSASDWSAQWIGVDNPVFPSNPAQTPAPTATPTSTPTNGPSPTPTPTSNATQTPTPALTNLLQNPDFEEGFYAPSQNTGWEWANGWSYLGTDWWRDGANFGVYNSPSRCQGVGTDWGTLDDTVYQTISVTPGQTYNLSAWTRVESDASGSNHVHRRIGIDPTGGTDPNGANVIHSPWDPTEETWQQMFLSATSQGSLLTVFIQVETIEPFGWQWLFVDDVSLVPEQTTSVATPTPSPTPTAEPTAPSSLTFDGSSWVWNAGDSPPPAGTRYFRGTVNIPAGTTILYAHWLITADDQFTGWVNGTQVVQSDGNPDSWQRPQVATLRNLTTGNNILAVEGINDALGPAGLLGKFVVTTSTGELTYVTNTGWKGTSNFSSGWMNTGFNDSGWANVMNWGDYPAPPWYGIALPSSPAATSKSLLAALQPEDYPADGIYRYNPLQETKAQPDKSTVDKGPVGALPPPAHLRREFSVNKSVRRATLYATALGIYEAYLNGGKVGDAWLAPGWTSYDKRVLYQTYDVTSQVIQGNNALGAILADGWYAGHTGLRRLDGEQRDYYEVDEGMPKRRFRAQLEIEYTDGTMDTIATDGSWRGARGPRNYADIMMGEHYDARNELTGWTSASYNDSSWQGVNVTSSVNTWVQSHPAPPIRTIQEFPALSVSQPVSGKYIFNLGQNFAGFIRLRVNLPAGTQLTIRHGERLYGDGTLNADNLKWADATDTYICKGGGEEVWQPRFTYHGFQYVEISGYPGTPPASAVTGIAIGSDIRKTGNLATSNNMVNQLHSNLYWTQRSNFLDIPTDCPQRAERLGWLGDAHIFVRTAAYTADVQAFFTKWIADMNDSRKNNLYRDFAPHMEIQGAGNGGWAEAGVAVPWAMYQAYGDRRVLDEWYDEMAAFVDAYAAGAPNYIRGGIGYGDWVDPDPNKDTPHEVIHTAYFAYAAALVRDMADVLGRSSDVTKFNNLFNNIKNAFNNAYVGGDGRIHGDTQTAYIIALQFDLLDAPYRGMAIDHLVNDIQSRGNHLSTGFIGTKDLMPVLTQVGRTDVAYDLLLQTSFPSWGYIVNQGATTTWEFWNNWSGQSHSHYTFGCVGEWMYRNIGGIDALEPGYEKIRIQPRPGGGLTWADTSYDSVRGNISTNWNVNGDSYQLDVTIPANTTAEVYVPSCDPLLVREGGLPVSQAAGVTYLRTENVFAVYDVESGDYSFTSQTDNCPAGVPEAGWSTW